uniref:RNA helicase n=1 Tax=Oryzias latipes TaxID=8090 RepID=A0A3P9KNL3_ORYLA
MSLPQDDEWETVPRRNLNKIVPDENQLANLAYSEIQDRIKWATLFKKNRHTEENRDVKIKVGYLKYQKSFSVTANDNKAVVSLKVSNWGHHSVYFSFETSEFWKSLFTFKDHRGKTFGTLERHCVNAGKIFTINVHFDSEHTGFYEVLFLFTFQTKEKPKEQFKMIRLIDVRRSTYKYMQLQLPQDPKFSEEVPHTSKTVPAKSENMNALKNVVVLQEFWLPREEGALEKAARELEQKPLNSENYARRFHMLLHLEELHLQESLDKYNQENVLVTAHKSNSETFTLKITGPSYNSSVVLSCCFVTLVPSDVDNKVYEGIVHDIREDRIFIKFLNEVPDRGVLRCGVTFKLNRMCLRMQHRAAAMAAERGLMDLLFPTRRLPRLLALNRPPRFEFNPEQQKAVTHILRRTAKPAAYLLCGPPGTGKTLTLVKAIMEIVKAQDINILVCAPSNSASDDICEKILKGLVDTDKVYRLYPLLHSIAKIPESLKKNCNLDQKKGTIKIPNKKSIMSRKILVTTLQTAGRLVTGGIPPKHYTYIFVDEAGQATETESMIPIAGLCDRSTCQVVLAGDPKQLGPVVISKTAEYHGLGVSLLERLMRDNDLYKPHEDFGFDSNFITKLLKNYRSHPAILKVPNDLFYGGELQPCARLSKLYNQLELLPKEGFPVVFHGVAGISQQEKGFSSFYNMAEIEVIKEYLKSLIQHLHRNNVSHVPPGEIGIISPYRKQVEKIQKAIQWDADLSKEHLENVEVGTVDKFQGKEFSVILMSTVRCFPKLKHKQNFILGFIRDDRRFNVAMTRARSLLVVVGDPRLLATDKNWNTFIHYCLKAGAYRGFTLFDRGLTQDTPTVADAPTLSTA